MIRPSVLLGALALTSIATAQPTRSSTPLPVGVASDDLAFAVDANPSLLPYVPRYSLVASHLRSDEGLGSSVGTDVRGAIVVGPIGLGLGFDRFDADVDSRGRFSLAAGYALSRATSMGLALRIVGPNGSLAGSNALDFALTLRPSTYFSIVWVATDVLGPVGLDGNGSRTIPAGFGVSAAFRPFGDERFTAELGVTARTDRYVAARLYASAAFSRGGRAFLVAQLEDLVREADGSLFAGVELRIDGIAAGSGWFARREGGDAFYAYASVDGRAASGVVERQHLVDVVLEGSTSVREFTGHMISLDRARIDPRVAGAVVRLRDSGIGLALAQELRYAIERLTERDRLVTCVLESPTGAELYACGAATEVFVEHAGTIRLLGPSVDLVTYGGLLETLGIHADFVRIGAYKSAPERFTHREPSAESIENTTGFLDDAYERMVFDLARDLGIDRSVIREAIDRGPLSPTDADDVGLIDGSLDVADLDDEIARLHGRPLPLERPSVAPDRRWGDAPGVAVVLIEGAIVDRDNVALPLLGTRASGADTIVATLDALRHDDSIRSVVLRIDSPGGSAPASDRIWRAVRRLARVKPVVASLGSIAASGGYYVATAAPTIYADPSTLTGSIGIYYGKVDVAALATRLGVGIASIERGEHAGALSMYRPFDEGERERLEVLVREGYDLFLERVSEGRERTVESLDGLCEGRIWSGDRAEGHGLVDRLGGLVAAIAHARVLADLPENAEVEVYPPRRSGLVDRVLGSALGSSAIPVAALSGLSFLVHTRGEGMWALAPLDDGVH